MKLRGGGRALAAVAAAAFLGGCGAATSGNKAAGPEAGSSRPGPSSPVSSSPAPPRAAPTTPCARNSRDQWVLVSLARQHMWMCDRHRVARDTAITSGMSGRDTQTPTGRYRIEGLNRNSILTLESGRTYPVKYWIPFDAPLFGFHDSSWQRFPYGSPRYRTAGSHGCVHMPLAAIKFLYRWAEIGTPVTIRA